MVVHLHAGTRNFNGNDSFTYKVNDGWPTATWPPSLTKLRSTTAPVAERQLQHQRGHAVVARRGLANDSDVDGDRLTRVLVRAAHGT
jgi:hypothetical protein